MTLRSGLVLALLVLAPLAGAQQFRTEKDLLGEKQVPAEAYYGVQTARSRTSASRARRSATTRTPSRRWRS